MYQIHSPNEVTDASGMQGRTDGSNLFTTRYVDANILNPVTELLNSAELLLNLTAQIQPQDTNDFRDCTYSPTILSSSFTTSSKVTIEEPICTARTTTNLVKQLQHSHHFSDCQVCDDQAVKDSVNNAFGADDHCSNKRSKRKNFRPQKRLTCFSIWTSDEDDSVSTSKPPSDAELERTLQKQNPVKRRRRGVPIRRRWTKMYARKENNQVQSNSATGRADQRPEERVKRGLAKTSFSLPLVTTTLTSIGPDQVIKRSEGNERRGAKEDFKGVRSRMNRMVANSRCRADRLSGGDAVSRAVKFHVERHRQAILACHPDVLHYPWVSERTENGGLRAILSPAGCDRQTVTETTANGRLRASQSRPGSERQTVTTSAKLPVDGHLGTERTDSSISTDRHVRSQQITGQSLESNLATSGHHPASCEGQDADRKGIRNKVSSGSGRKVKDACSPNFAAAVSQTHGRVPGDAFKVDKPKPPIACTTCSSRFFTCAGLRAHQRVIHEERRNFSCQLCFRQFARPHDLKRHQQVHSDERHYGCQYCSKMFKYKSNVRLHEMIHTGERPLTCTMCNFRCIQKASITWHMRAYHGDHGVPATSLSPDTSGLAGGGDTPTGQGSNEALSRPVGPNP